MSVPVHVIVSGNEADEQAWLARFGGGADVYRFKTNVEALERLSTAQSPLDLLVITPHQDSLFNTGTGELVHRLTTAPLAQHGPVQRMRIIVVGEQLAINAPHVRCVATLNDAMQLVTFGDTAPMPHAAPAAPAAMAAPRPSMPQSMTPRLALTPPRSMSAPATYMSPAASAPSAFDEAAVAERAQSIIDQIWNAPKQRLTGAAQAPRVMAGGPVARTRKAQRKGSAVHHAPVAPDAVGGAGGLFASTAPTRVQRPVAAVEPVVPQQHTVAGLEPSVPYQVPGRGAFRGGAAAHQQPAVVQQLVHPAGAPTMPSAPAVPSAAMAMPQAHAPHAAPAQQMPQAQPAMGLADHIASAVYAGGNGVPQDPLLGWSAPVQQMLAAQPGYRESLVAAAMAPARPAQPQRIYQTEPQRPSRRGGLSRMFRRNEPEQRPVPIMQTESMSPTAPGVHQQVMHGAPMYGNGPMVMNTNASPTQPMVAPQQYAQAAPVAQQQYAPAGQVAPQQYAPHGQASPAPTNAVFAAGGSVLSRLDDGGASFG